MPTAQGRAGGPLGAVGLQAWLCSGPCPRDGLCARRLLWTGLPDPDSPGTTATRAPGHSLGHHWDTHPGASDWAFLELCGRPGGTGPDHWVPRDPSSATSAGHSPCDALCHMHGTCDVCAMLICVTCVPLRTLVVGACVLLTCWALGEPPHGAPECTVRPTAGSRPGAASWSDSDWSPWLRGGLPNGAAPRLSPQLPPCCCRPRSRP